MWKQKYNFDKIKKEFLESSYDEVKPFMQAIYHTYTSHIKNKTKGWSDEKKMLKKDVKNIVIEEIKEELKEYYKPSMEELWDMHKQLVQLSKAKINTMTRTMKEKLEWKRIKDDVSIKDIKTLWDMVKAEKNEPTSYMRTESDTNITHNILDEEDRKMLDDLIDENL